MAIPGGLGLQVGLGEESRYGTYVAPTTFIKPEEGISLGTELQYQRVAALGGNQIMQEDGLHIQTTRDGRLTIPAAMRDNGFGRLLNQLHGETVTPVRQTGGIFRQTHPIGRSFSTGKSLTVQVGVPQLDGTAQPFSYVGSKVTQATLSLDVAGLLMSSWEIDAQDVLTSRSLETAVYPTRSMPFVGADTSTSVEFDDIVVADCIRSFTLQVPMPLNLDRRCIGSGALKNEPVPNGMMAPTLEAAMEFRSMAEYTAFRSSTRRKIRFHIAGRTISGTFGTAVDITCATATPVTGGPTINGYDLVTQTVNFELTDAGGAAAPLIIDYFTRDSAL